MSPSPFTQEGRIEISLSLLPPIARKKFRALEALASDEGALTKAALARVNSAETRLFEIQRSARRLDPRVDGELIEERGREHEEVRDELDRAQDALNKRNGIRGNAEQIVSQLKYNFLAAENCQGPWGCRAYAGPPAKPREGESLVDAILRTRGEISQVQGYLIGVKSVPPTADEIKAAVVAEVNKLAKEGTPTFSFDGGKVKINWPDVQLYGPPNQGLAAPSGSASKEFCWLFPDKVIAKLSAEAEARGGDLSAAERRERIAQLEVRLAELEHEDESLVEQAIAAGVEVHRRTAASAYALLGIELNPAPKAVAAE
jgi:hypothetical protein